MKTDDMSSQSGSPPRRRPPGTFERADGRDLVPDASPLGDDSDRLEEASCDGDYARGGGRSGLRTAEGGVNTTSRSGASGAALGSSIEIAKDAIASGAHGVIS